MRILICNKFFFLNGGTDRYFFELMEELDRQRHSAIPFSVRHGISKNSPYLKYFLAPPGAADQTHFDHLKLTRANWFRLLDRSIYSWEARRCLDRLIRAEGPIDIGYLLNIYNYMSPSIIDTFRRHHIPVVLRLGDYHLQCASYLFLRDGKPCTLCLRGAYYHGIQYRCVKQSFLVSAIRVAAMYLHRWLGLHDQVAAIVVPCEFMKAMLIAGGFPATKIHRIASPVPTHCRQLSSELAHKEEYFLYFGRITPEKGLDTLIEAFQQIAASTKVNLVVLGRDYDGERERLTRLIQPRYQDRIRFLGFIEGEELDRWIGKALFTVAPSRWYDNAPLSVYESFAHGTPVLASRMGGIPEQISDGETGKLFAAGSVVELAAALQWMLADRKRLEVMGQRGRTAVLEQHDWLGHTGKLLNLFEDIIRRYRRSGA